MKKLILMAILALSNSAFANSLQLPGSNCSKSYIDQYEYLSYIEPGSQSAEIDTAKAYLYQQQCNSLTGCGKKIQALNKLKSGSYFGSQRSQSHKLLSENIDLLVKIRNKKVYLEMLWDSHTYSYQINKRGSAQRTVNVGQVKGMAVIKRGKNVHKFTSFSGNRTSRFGTEGMSYSIFAGSGSAKLFKLYKQNYVYVTPLTGGITQDGCIYFESVKNTEADRHGNYMKYTTIITNR